MCWVGGLRLGTFLEAPGFAVPHTRILRLLKSHRYQFFPRELSMKPSLWVQESVSSVVSLVQVGLKVMKLRNFSEADIQRPKPKVCTESMPENGMGGIRSSVGTERHCSL
jgi:hypothetical protein